MAKVAAAGLIFQAVLFESGARTVLLEKGRLQVKCFTAPVARRGLYRYDSDAIGWTLTWAHKAPSSTR